MPPGSSRPTPCSSASNGGSARRSSSRRCGERRIPHEAMAAVTLTPGKRGTVVLRAVPRPGADPLMEAAAGQLKEGCDPVPAGAAGRARDARRVLRRRAARRCSPATRTSPPNGYLVAAPEAPLQLQGVRREGVLRRRAGRPSAGSGRARRRRSGRRATRRFPVGGAERGRVALAGGLRRAICGCCTRGPGEPGGRAAQADQDPAAVRLRARVRAGARVAAVRGGGAGSGSRPPGPGGRRPGRLRGARDPADVAERIRHLGELHQAGLVTDEEFSVEEGGAAGGAVAERLGGGRFGACAGAGGRGLLRSSPRPWHPAPPWYGTVTPGPPSGATCPGSGRPPPGPRSAPAAPVPPRVSVDPGRRRVLLQPAPLAGAGDRDDGQAVHRGLLLDPGQGDLRRASRRAPRRSSRTGSSRAALAVALSPVKRGWCRRKSSSVRSLSASVKAPVRKPRPSGEYGTKVDAQLAPPRRTALASTSRLNSDHSDWSGGDRVHGVRLAQFGGRSPRSARGA